MNNNALKKSGIVLSVTLCLLLLCVRYTYSQNLLGGYTDKQSYVEGETVIFYTQDEFTSSNPVAYGLFNINGDLIEMIDSFVMTNQPDADTTGSSAGFKYIPTRSWVVPKEMPSGLYYLGKNTTDEYSRIYVIIRRYDRLSTGIVIVIPTNTNAAYNLSGLEKTGGLYTKDKDGIIQPVSFYRPLKGQKYFTSFYTPFLKWFSKVGFAEKYAINVISDYDMDDINEITNAKLLLIIGHSEYWTREARINFDHFIDHGGNALILSGNTMYRPVRYQDISTNKDNPQLVCYKDKGEPNNLDPLLDTKYTFNDTANYHYSKSLNYSTLASIGADSKRGGFQNSEKFQRGDNEDTFYKYNSIGFFGQKVILPNSPLLQGTNLKYNDKIVMGTDFGPENDGTLLSNIDTLTGKVNEDEEPILDLAALGFYRGEIIAYDRVEMLKSGHRRYQPTDDVIYSYIPIMAFQKNCSSGKIVNVNTNAWCSKSMIGNDPTVQKITENMIGLNYTGTTIFANPEPNSFSLKYSPIGVGYKSCSSINITACGIVPDNNLYKVNNFGFHAGITPIGCIVRKPQNQRLGSPHDPNNEIFNANQPSLIITPNPNIGLFTINFPYIGGEATLTITDIKGCEIYKTSPQKPQVLIELPNQPSGIYILRIKTNDGIYTGKIVVQK